MNVLDEPADVWHALSAPARREILGLLATAPSDATGLAQRLDISRQAVMKHLSVLTAAALVTATRSGRRVDYRVNPRELRRAGDSLTAAAAAWDAQLGLVKDAVESRR